ncbi:MAG: glutamate 5-kinase [Tissierellia bacterium]|nr:glutamate 5-kinase [Tissierellia bacterium]
MRKFSNELKRIVIKVGSSSITHEGGEVNLERIWDLAWEISNLKNQGIDVVLVSSGAIAAGAKRMGFTERPKDISGKQAAASVGQVALMQTYSRAFSEFNYAVGQILVTKHIITDPVMNENARNTFNELIELNVVPIVNENDTISTYEIQFGDNDTLSALVSVAIEADLLILLSDVDGFYDRNPSDPEAIMMKEICTIDDEVRSCAGGAGTSVGTGGMVTKLNAASICMEQGIDMVLANSKDLKVLRSIVKGEDVGTLFRGE